MSVSINGLLFKKKVIGINYLLRHISWDFLSHFLYLNMGKGHPNDGNMVEPVGKRKENVDKRRERIEMVGKVKFINFL